MVIVGGGVTGLIAALFAAKDGRKVKVIEGSGALGGLISTFEAGGTNLEKFYHHFFTHDAEINWLVKELGLENQLFFKKTSMGVFRDDKIYEFNGPADLLKFKPMNFFDKIRFGMTSIFLGKLAKWDKYEDVSCSDWLSRWAGKSSTKSLWAPMLNVKFGPYADEVPLSWLIGRLRQRLNSRKNGDEKLGYLTGSLSTLLDALLQKLNDLEVELILNSPIEKIHTKNSVVDHIIAGGKKVEGSQFLMTIPGIFLGPVLKDVAPALSKNLLQIEYFGAACLILELDRPLSEIYWLNIADPDYPFGGVIEHTNFIDSSNYDDRNIIYLSRYYAHHEAFAKLTTEEMTNTMIESLPRIYPEFSEKWVLEKKLFRTNTAAPVCDKRFSAKVPDCQTELSNLYIANMAHVYPDERSVNNSIRVAAEACRVMGCETSYVPRNQSLSGQLGF